MSRCVQVSLWQRTSVRACVSECVYFSSSSSILLLPPPPTTLTRSRFSSLPRPPTDLLFPSSPASPFARRSRACKTAKSVTRSHFLESLSPPLIVNHTHGVPLLFSFLSSLLLLFLAPLARFTRIDGGCTYRYATNNFIYSRIHTLAAFTRFKHDGGIVSRGRYDVSEVWKAPITTSGESIRRIALASVRDRANACKNPGCMPGVSDMMDCGRPLCSH